MPRIYGLNMGDFVFYSRGHVMSLKDEIFLISRTGEKLAGKKRGRYVCGTRFKEMKGGMSRLWDEFRREKRVNFTALG